MLEIKNLRYGGFLEVDSLKLAAGEAIVLSGPSGSGKTTLLNIVAGLRQPEQGEIYFNNERIDNLPLTERDKWRGENIGFIYQNFNLINSLTVAENLWAVEYFTGKKLNFDINKRTTELLNLVGIGDKQAKYPEELSMGEQQRASVARALLMEPALILADEPTASLDYPNAMKVISLLKTACAENNTALLVSTHDESIKQQFGRIVKLRKEA